MSDWRRPLGRLLCCVLFPLIVVATMHGAGPAKTQINDVIYRADGTPASGTLLISWPAFVTADQLAVAAGNLSVKIGDGGAVSIGLAPNEASLPSGTYYRVVLKLDDGSTSTEYWTVPARSSTTVSAIRATVAPASVALQTVSKQYVDAAVGGKANDTDVLHLAGSESVVGNKTFLGVENFKNDNGVRSALNFGSLDAALSDCGGSPCTVQAEAGMGASTPTYSAWQETAGIFDYRGTGDKIAANFQVSRGPLVVWQKKTSDIAGNEIYAPAMFAYMREMGGGSQTNKLTGANKTSGRALIASLRSKGYAQDMAFEADCYKDGSGECHAIWAYVQHGGNSLTYGDEGAKGAKVHVTDADGSGSLYNGTVASATDNGDGTMTVQLSAQNNKTMRGEGRWIIRTDAAAYNSGSATVSSSASPPTVSITGGDFTALGLGAHSDLCFESVQDRSGTTSAYKYVVPVKSIDSTTALTLDYQMDGGAYTTWSGKAGASAYNIWYCGQIQKLGFDGNGGATGTGWLRVSKGYRNWASGQMFEQPLGYANYTVGAQVNVQAYVPKANNHSGITGLQVSSLGPVNADSGVLLTGTIKTNGLYLSNSWQAAQTTFGLRFAANPTNVISIDSFTGTSSVFAQYADGANWSQMKWYPGGAGDAIWRFYRTDKTTGYIDFYSSGKVDAATFSARTSVVTPKINMALSTPASSSAACTVGDMAQDSGYIYVCTAANQWKRAALATW